MQEQHDHVCAYPLWQSQSPPAVQTCFQSESEQTASWVTYSALSHVMAYVRDRHSVWCALHTPKPQYWSVPHEVPKLWNWPALVQHVLLSGRGPKNKEEGGGAMIMTMPNQAHAGTLIYVS